ncbi:MAG TPA: response regulator [Chloroflexi bacterium]|nr:response regulator [Chloroflexota bacterium]
MARILIIDDNPDMLQMLQMVLENRGGHTVTLTPDGQEGLSQALTNPPDLAIVDVMMPDMNGYEVVRRLRENPRTAEIGIIILTARGQAVDKTAALEAGADAHTTKPVDINELLELVENTLNPRRMLSQQGLFPVFSLRGGIGVTTLAVNLALALTKMNINTVLWDMAYNGGHCALYLGMKTKHHWGILFQSPELRVQRLLSEHASGLKLLAAPPYPLQEDRLTSEQVTTILAELRQSADIIIIDLPATLSPEVGTVLDHADQILLLSGDDPPGIQRTMLALRARQQQIKQIHLLFNNVTPGPRPPLEALQKVLQMPVMAQIAYDPTQTTLVRRNTPAMLSDHPGELAKSIAQIAQQLRSS